MLLEGTVNVQQNVQQVERERREIIHITNLEILERKSRLEHFEDFFKIIFQFVFFEIFGESIILDDDEILVITIFLLKISVFTLFLRRVGKLRLQCCFF